MLHDNRDPGDYSLPGTEEETSARVCPGLYGWNVAALTFEPQSCPAPEFNSKYTLSSALSLLLCWGLHDYRAPSQSPNSSSWTSHTPVLSLSS